ncbi:MAG: type 1 glutamine amidotransferase domain-containing protein [Rariglobus sp.]
MRFLIGLWVLAFSCAGVSVTAAEPRQILLVLTNHAQLGDTGVATGFFLSEAAHPWEVFRKAGYAVTLASPRGGFAPVDPKSFKLDDPANASFWREYGGKVEGVDGVAKTRALAELKPEAYAAVFFAGGHGAMWDFPNNPEIARLSAGIYERGGVVGSVCHGPAALVGVKLADGTPLVSGRQVAVFSNAEEAAVKLTSVVPFLLADELARAGAKPVVGADFQENAVRDGRLVTGQNPASATKAARLLVEALTSVAAEKP